MAGRSVIKVLIDGDTKGLDSALGKADNKLGAFAKTAAKSFAVMGAAVVGGGLAIGKQLIQAAEEAAATDAKVQQITKSMGLFGNQAGEVSNRLLELATATGLQVGVDDDIIKSTQAKLLTFKELAGTADEVGGAFDRATMAAVDLAAAGFGNAESNAVQLGKALNDPVKGLAALTKSGITFTEAEKEMIAAMVESGNVLGAQEMILAAIETQVGGTAAATATASGKMGVAFGELQESLGALLLPAFQKFTDFLVTKVFPAGERLAQKWGPVLGDALRSVGDVLKQIGEVVGSVLGPALDKVGKFFSENTEVAKAFFATLAGGVVLGALIALGAALAALLSPAVLITAAIAALVAGLVYAWNNFETFRNVVTTVVEAVQTAVAAFVEFVTTAWAEWGDEITAIAQDTWALIQAVVERAVESVRVIIATVTAAIQFIWSRWGEEITAVVVRAWEYIRATVENVLNVIRGIIQVVTALIQGDWSAAWEGVKRILVGVWEQMKNVISLAWDGIKAVVKAGIDGVIGFVKAIPERIAAVAVGAFDALKEAFRSAVNFIIGGWNRLEFKIPGFKIGPIGYDGFTLGVPDIPYLAKGGIVTRPTLAMVGEAGPEAVIPLSRGRQPMGNTVNITVNAGLGADGQQIGREVVKALRNYQLVNGPLPIKVA